jgi:hypothetical protein
MTAGLRNTNNKNSFSNPLLWVVFGLYIIIASYTMYHHELWGDEFHSWNIAKGSSSFFDLIYNRRYEGHPPVWYTVLWIISKFTHNLVYVQIVHLILAILVIFVMLFYSPLPTGTKLLLPFGYYFIFEYAILSRNYVLAVLAGFLICIIINKEFKYKLIIYYLLLFFMSNVHLIGMLLAGSLHLYFLISSVEKKKKRSFVVLHTLFGILIFLPAIHYISQPPESKISILYYVVRWTPSIFAIDLQAPLRAFAPIPAWWEYNFWNTQFLLQLHSTYRILKIVNPLLAFTFIGIGCYILYDNKKSLAVFVANVVVTFLVGNIFGLITQRYSGFIFIGFVVAFWLYCYDTPVQKNKKIIVLGLLCIQLIAGIFIVTKDIELPFSNGYKVKELIAKVPPKEKMATDFCAFNTISACTDQSYYCVDIERSISFIVWSNDKPMLDDKTRYCDGLNYLFKKDGIKTVYIISISPPALLDKTDKKLFSTFRVELVDKREGAIEKGSNLYLYKISAL